MSAVVNSMKRVRVAEPTVLSNTTAQTVSSNAGGGSKQNKKKRKAENLQAPTVNAPLVAQRQSVGSLCRSNCCLEGCSRGTSCKFDHVKDVRTLTAAEKESMKKLIAKHNESTAEIHTHYG